VRALVTGADGFVGRWLSDHLDSAGDEVWRAAGPNGTAGEHVRPSDLAEPDAPAELLAWARPDAVYHLAAVSSGADAARDPAHAIDVTVAATVRLLEAAAALESPPLILVPSSAEAYGDAGSAPIDEGRPLMPANLYGATKAAQEAVALAYHRAGRLPVAVARAFNHIGPGQRPSFVAPALATQLAAIAAGAAGPVRVGNLETRRDFSDVRDVVRAYRLIVAGGHAGEPLNVASETAVPIRTLLDELIAASGLRVDVEVDPARVRHVDVPVLVGNASRLRGLTGWRPERSFTSTVRDIWEDARTRVPSGGVAS
jgi:GDP-4-dehydro-6-deoxy-D-mannose reductase